MKGIGSRRLRGLLLWALAGELFLHASLRAETADLEQLAPRVRIKNGLTARAVRLSVAGARRRLRHPACGAMFAELSSVPGRSLQAELDEHGHTADGFLAQLFFYDGSRQHACASEVNLAATEPGSRVVMICPRAFTRMHARNPLETELVVIHELLHTLGLGENPPSSAEINAYVESRCSAAAD